MIGFVINGQHYDHAGISITIAGMPRKIEVTSITYSAGSGSKVVTQKGVPKGTARGNFTNSFNMKIFRHEWDKLVAMTAYSGGVLNDTPYTINISYHTGSKLQPATKDELRVVFTGANDFGGGDGEGELQVSVDGALTKFPKTNGFSWYSRTK